MRLFWMTLPALVAVTACEVKDADSGHADHDHDADADADGGTDADDTGVAPEIHTPAEGIWEASNWTIDDDGCNLELLYGFTAEAVLLFEGANSDTGFTLTSADGTAWTCTQADGSNDLSCNATTSFDFSAGATLPSGAEVPAVDAVVTLASEVSGVLTSDSAVTASTTWSGSCEGADCATVLAVAGVEGETCTTTVSSFDNVVIPAEDVQTPGDYLQAAFAWTEDGCDFENNTGLPGFPETTFTISQRFDEDGTFIGTNALSSASGITYDCTPDAANSLNFTCDAAPQGTLGGGELLDATVTLTLYASGRTTSHTSYNGTGRMEATCEGEDCEALATVVWGIEGFPCDSTGSTTAAIPSETSPEDTDADADGGTDDTGTGGDDTATGDDDTGEMK